MSRRVMWGVRVEVSKGEHITVWPNDRKQDAERCNRNFENGKGQIVRVAWYS